MKHVVLAILMLFVTAQADAFDTTKTPVSKDGTKAIIDLPGSQHMQNTGGTDGYGLCVDTSVEVAGRWQNVPEIKGFQEWCTHRPGGSDPDQLPKDLVRFAKDKKVTLPSYIQHTGSDDELMKLIFKTRRMPCMTYAGVDGFYSDTIAHMVNGAHMDDKLFAIIDNNRPGSWVWMPTPIGLNRWKGLDDNGKPLTIGLGGGRFFPHLRFRGVPVGGGWVFCWLNPPPPPRDGNASIPAPAPIIPRRDVVWEKHVFVNAGIHWFCKDRQGHLLGVLNAKGWHRAIGPDGWEDETSPVPKDIDCPQCGPDPLAPPDCPDNKWGTGSAGAVVPTENRYWVNGEETTRFGAISAILLSLLDDSDNYHLSLVGLDRKLVASWFAEGGPLAKYRPILHVQAYDRTDWVVSDRLNSAATIQYPAKKGGKVLARWIASTAPDLKDVTAMLAAVFDPPTPPIDPIKPDPTPPAPPAPPKPDPAPPIIPVTPAPAPSVPQKGDSWVTLLIAFLTAIFWRKK